jgi:hypothetical protein
MVQILKDGNNVEKLVDLNQCKQVILVNHISVTITFQEELDHIIGNLMLDEAHPSIKELPSTSRKNSISQWIFGPQND